MDKTDIQDTLFDLEPVQNEIEDDKTKGNRLSPSQIEIISQIYEKYNNSNNEISFLFDILKPKEINRNEILKNAKWSIYGTQIHNLTYFTQIFERARRLDRDPIPSDFRNTFIYKNNDFYTVMEELLNLTDMKCSNPAQAFWNEWRMNEQDFTPKKENSYLIKPEEIQRIWENNPIPLKDIEEFNTHVHKIDEKKLNPYETMVINEVTVITNIYFPNSSMQVPAVIDEICIPKNFPNEPIQIIDYKTGKQFKQPEFKEKVQIFLMMSAVYTNILDKVNSIKFMPSEWEIAHNVYEFPFLKKRRLKNNLIGSVYFENLIQSIDIFNNYFNFSYINPITQEKININTKDIGIDATEGMNNMIWYLENLNIFYTKYKEILKKRLKNENLPYFLPTFSKRNLDNNLQRYLQSSLI